MKINPIHVPKREKNRCSICGSNIVNGVCAVCGWVQIIFPNQVPLEITDFDTQRKEIARNLYKGACTSKKETEELRRTIDAEVSKNKTLEDSLKEEKAKRTAVEQEKEHYRDQADKATKELASLKKKNQDLIANIQDLTSEIKSLKMEKDNAGEKSVCKAGELSFKELNGTKYCGDISVDNERSGFGICKSENESYYAGEWKLDMRSGLGLEVNAVNSKYIGEWNFNRKNGIGTIIQKDGIRYSGEWKNGKMHGIGTLFYPNGERLSARFSSGLLQQGTGVYYLQDGSCIIGYMTKNGPDGNCLHYKKDGSCENEYWNNGIKLK